MFTDSRGYTRTDSLEEIKSWCHSIINMNREKGRKVTFSFDKTAGENQTVKNYPLTIMVFVEKGKFPDNPDYINMKEYQNDNFVLDVAVSTNVIDFSSILSILISTIAIPGNEWAKFYTILVLIIINFLPKFSKTILKWCIKQELNKDGIIIFN